MQIKLKIDNPQLSKQLDLKQQRWEDEGGRSISADDLDIDQIDAPLKDGQKFEVLKGHVISEDDEIYYIAEIKPLEM
ncbi:MAG: hypothetical protein ACQETE_11225 [Bacteroidota bacterium]